MASFSQQYLKGKQMDFPKELKYTKDHEWVRIDGNVAEIGVTEFAVDQLGDIVHIDMPEIGDDLEAGSSFGTIESTKTVSDLYLPVNGKVKEINTSLEDAPESIQEKPYSCWIVKVEGSDLATSDQLMTQEDYEKFVAEQED
jgi:glycine cleavage system H protein